MAPWHLILLVLAFVLFLIAGFVTIWVSTERPIRVNFIALGLAAWVLAQLVSSSTK